MAQKVLLQDGSSLYNINPRLDTINPLLGPQLHPSSEHYQKELRDIIFVRVPPTGHCRYEFTITLINWNNYWSKLTLYCRNIWTRISKIIFYSPLQPTNTFDIEEKCWQRPPSQGCLSELSFPSATVLVMQFYCNWLGLKGEMSWIKGTIIWYEWRVKTRFDSITSVTEFLEAYRQCWISRLMS